jgi:membrane protein DedA with SNARE-associated domain
MGGITGTITDWIGSGGVYAVFGLMAFDAVFPAASEVVMVYAGALAAGAFPDHHVTLFGTRIESETWGYVVMALAGTIGYLLGSLVGWVIGAWGGRPLLERHGRWLHLTPEKLERAERWFARWEDWAVLLGRILPVVRSFISIPAGVVRAPLGRYTLFTLVGSAIWCFAFAGIGLGVGTGWERFHQRFQWADYVFVGILVLAVLLLAVRLLRPRRRPAAEPPADR